MSDGPPGASPDPAPTLSIVMPAHNEQDGIDRAIDAAQQVLLDLSASGAIGAGEVVIVDDGSTDSTAARIESRAGEHPPVRLLSLDRNRGLGAAVGHGLRAATGDLILYTDADLPFDLAEVATALRLIGDPDVDLVSAFRFDRAGEGLRRWTYSHLYNALIRARFGLRVRDVNFAAKLMRRAVVEEVTLRSEGSFVDAELLVKAERHGFGIAQFGVDYQPRSRGTSTLSSLGVIRTIVAEMRGITPEIRAIGPRPVRR